MQPQEQEDWRGRFERLFIEGNVWQSADGSTVYSAVGNMENFIATEIERAKAETYQEVIALSNGIEIEAVKYSGTPLEEWKAFKHFRNTLHDKLKQL